MRPLLLPPIARTGDAIAAAVNPKNALRMMAIFSVLFVRAKAKAERSPRHRKSHRPLRTPFSDIQSIWCPRRKRTGSYGTFEPTTGLAANDPNCGLWALSIATAKTNKVAILHKSRCCTVTANVLPSHLATHGVPIDALRYELSQFSVGKDQVMSALNRHIELQPCYLDQLDPISVSYIHRVPWFADDKAAFHPIADIAIALRAVPTRAGTAFAIRVSAAPSGSRRRGERPRH